MAFNVDIGYCAGRLYRRRLQDTSYDAFSQAGPITRVKLPGKFLWDCDPTRRNQDHNPPQTYWEYQNRYNQVWAGILLPQIYVAA